MENVNVGDTISVDMPKLEIEGHYTVLRIDKSGSVMVHSGGINCWVIPGCYSLVEKAEETLRENRPELFFSEE